MVARLRARCFRGLNMSIHTDRNGVAVNAISCTANGDDVTGHLYQVLHGRTTSELCFQQGPVKECGVNGLTNEARQVEGGAKA